MPWNPAQHRLFEAAAHNPAIARHKGIAVTDARRMASEGVKKSRGGLARYAEGGMTDEVPTYQLPQNSPMPGVQLLPWNQIDPYTPAATYASTLGLKRGGPVVRLAEGGDPSSAPNAYARALNFLSTQQRGPGSSGGGTRPPPIGGGRSLATIGADVDPGYGGTRADPKIDMRSAALEAINRRFKTENDLSTAEAEVPSIMSSRMGDPTLASYAPHNMGALNPYRRSQLPLDVQLMTRPQQLAKGGEVERLVDLLKNTPRSGRFAALRENKMRNITKDTEFMSHLASPGSPLHLVGGYPDAKLGSAIRMAPRSRQRFGLFDTSVAGDDGYARDVGSLAANWHANYLPNDMIDLDIRKPMQRQGYGKEATALMMSNLPDENAWLKLWDVKRSAKPYWESLGAQMDDPSRPFRQKDKFGYTDGLYDPKKSQHRNNDYKLILGDLLDNVDEFAEGGEVSSGGADLAMLGAGLAASRLRPRHINRLARPVMRALSKPTLAVEAVSDKPLSRGQSDARFKFARDMAADSHAMRFSGDDSFRDLPVERGQGAWMGEKGMEFNPLYMSELPRSLRRVRDQEDNLRYASQIGENLEQAATPVTRFVPHLLNSEDDSNALMVHGIDDAKLRRLAEILGPDIVTAHQPRSRALVFPTDDRPMGGIADEINAGFGFPKMRFGRSDLDKDRLLLARKPLGYESALYSDFDALPRSRMYSDAENQAVATKGWRPRLSFTGAK